MKKSMQYLFRLLVLMLFINFTNCEKEQLDEVIIASNESPYTLTRVTQEDYKNNEKLISKLGCLNKSRNEDTANREIYNSQYDFYVETDRAKYLESNDGSFHTYTFAISSDETDNAKYNLIFKLEPDGSYSSKIAQYIFNDDSFEVRYLDISLDADNYILRSSDLNFYEECVTTYSFDCNTWFDDGRCASHIYVVTTTCTTYVYIDSTNSSGTYGPSYTTTSTSENVYWVATGGSTNGTTGNNTQSNNPITGSSYISPIFNREFNQQIATFPQELQDFLNENFINKLELLIFLEANDYSAEAIEEAKLKALFEYVDDETDPKWTPASGQYNNNPALAFDATWAVPSTMGGGRMFRISDGTKAFYATPTDFPINNQNSTVIPTSEIPTDGNNHYVFDSETQRWYEYGLPLYAPTDCLSCALNTFFEAVISNTIIITGRYFLPIEDVVILITGENFEGVASSRATAGAFLLLDIIPGTTLIKGIKLIKYGDEAIDAATLVVKRVDEVLDAVYQTQKQLVDEYLEIIGEATNARKGNFGEMATDVAMSEKGYQRLQVNPIVDIDANGHSGIDHIFKNAQTGEYIIMESKFRSMAVSPNSLPSSSPTLDGMQMTDTWILGTNTGNNRILEAVGNNLTLANEIADSNYIRVFSRILPDGSIKYFKFDGVGNYIGEWMP